MDYQIQNSWQTGDRINTLVIVADVRDDLKLIEVCDEIYEKYIKDFNEVRIIFFHNCDDAIEYAFNRFVLDHNELEAIEKTNVCGYLIGSELVSKNSPAHLIKLYKNPKK